jgi:hypothetical protein
VTGTSAATSDAVIALPPPLLLMSIVFALVLLVLVLLAPMLLTAGCDNGVYLSAAPPDLYTNVSTWTHTRAHTLPTPTVSLVDPVACRERSTRTAASAAQPPLSTSSPAPM